MSSKIGAEFEGQVQDRLDKLKNMSLLSYVRLYDTKSTGRKGHTLPRQPGDFIVAAGRAHLLEVKASEKYETFTQCYRNMVEPHQAAAARLWRKSGNLSWFLFWSLPAQRLELWSGKQVGEAFVGKGDIGIPEVFVSSASLAELLQATFVGPTKE